ncbi:BLIP family protein [Streptomyces sp. NPDC058466]|uniref:BLIP family protein n=1 Tax=unclassified Streptomyces TaxID=2593676 RepID=UPI003654AF2C
MVNMWRYGGAVVAACAVALGVGTDAQAYSGFTAEKYNQIQFGMTKDQVWAIGGGSQACETGGVIGDGILCWAESGDYVPYGGFSFTADGKLYNKRSEFLFKAKTPSIRLAQYNRTALGMTEPQVWAVVPKDSCVMQQETYANWPATDGHALQYYCPSATGLFPPSAYLTFTDGKLTARSQRSLT